MKPILLVFILCCSLFSFAQIPAIDLPLSTFIIPYKLSIGYNKTTILIFPSKVLPGDKSLSDLDFIVSKQNGKNNILKIKAARSSFPTGSLTVFTSDGRVYPFLVNYTDSVSEIIYDLGKLSAQQRKTNAGVTPVMITSKIFDDSQADSLVKIIDRDQPRFFRKYSKYKMRIRLCNIKYINHCFFFRYQLTNYSDLPYPIDFFRMYTFDSKKLKRSSTQENDLIPVYQDTLTEIPPQTKVNFVIAVPSFTIPNSQKCVIEMNEQNGGRNVKLAIKNKDLMTSQPY